MNKQNNVGVLLFFLVDLILGIYASQKKSIFLLCLKKREPRAKIFPMLTERKGGIKRTLTVLLLLAEEKLSALVYTGM